MQKCIPLKEAQAEMILAQAVTDDQDRTLCAEGTKITERLIKRFEEIGVAVIYIESEEEMSREEYLALKKIVEKRFIAVSSPDSLLGRLKEAVLERLEIKKGL